MLYDPDRHEPCSANDWDEARARAMIAAIVTDAEARFSSDAYWPIHPRDADDGGTLPAYPLYYGACGVIWALRHLHRVGAARLKRTYAPHVPALIERNRAWLATAGTDEPAAYMMGELSILMLMYADAPSPDIADRLAALIERNITNPTRELMWGAPGTLLAASFMHEHTAEIRWAELFRRTARTCGRS